MDPQEVKDGNTDKYHRNRIQTGYRIPGKNYNFSRSRKGHGGSCSGGCSGGRRHPLDNYLTKAARTKNRSLMANSHVSDSNDIVGKADLSGRDLRKEYSGTPFNCP